MLPLKSISWKFEAIIFNIDEYMEVRSDMERDVKKGVNSNMTSECWFSVACWLSFAQYNHLTNIMYSQASSML